MARKPINPVIARTAAALIIIPGLIYLFLTPQHKCSDLTFKIQHPLQNPNRTIEVFPVNPTQTYSDLLIFTYHSSTEKLMRNNANCQLHITGVEGMVRNQLQNLKPYLVKGAIQHARSPHVAYIDWDANFIRRPRNPRKNLIVQAAHTGNITITGTIILFNAKQYIPLMDRWISHEIPDNADQQSWALMERAGKVELDRTADGDLAENYNWNVVGKVNTTVRCAKVILVNNYFIFLLNIGIVVALVLKIYDFWSMETKGHCPRRAYLSVVLVVALVCAVLFRENYHEQIEVTRKFESERVCAIPELAVKEDGQLVTRYETTTGPNAFLYMAIKAVGLGGVATMLTFWFTLISKLRLFARVMVAIEAVSMLSGIVAKRTARAESLVWCTLVQWRDFDKGSLFRRVIARQWRDGEARVGLVGKEGEVASSAVERSNS